MEVDRYILFISSTILMISHFLVTGWGDITYNPRRNMLAAISVANKISYHLFKIDTNAARPGEIARLYRKAKWHSQYSTLNGNLA